MPSLNNPPSYQAICAILDSEPFSMHTIPKLEEYLQEQVDTDTYDFLANKALLKLYQFYPETTNDDMVALVAVKALMALPSTDLLTLMYLIPDRLAIREPIRTLTRCFQTIETAHFKDFWEAANLGSNPLLDNTPGFADSVRKCILGMISETCQKYPIDTFSEAVNLSGPELKKFAEESKLKLEDDMVIFILNAENQRKPKKFKETVQLDNMFNIVHAVEGF